MELGFEELQEVSQKFITRTLTPSDVKEVMKKYPQDVSAMTPEGFWVVNWEPFQTMASNYDLITRDATVHVTLAKEGRLLAVSFVGYFKVKVGLRCRADYFVRPELANDKELLVSHLMKHLIHIHQFNKSLNVSYSLLYPQGVANTGQAIKDMVDKKLNLHQVDTTELTCLVLRRHLPQNNGQSKL